MRPPCATSSSSPQQNWSTEQESNLRPSVYQTDAQAAVLLVGGAPCKNRTCFFATGAAHRRQCLRGQKLGASGANRTPIGRLPCDRSATELHRLEPKGGFEPPSELYEGSVFPTKLLRPSERRPGASNRTRTGVWTMARSNPSR